MLERKGRGLDDEGRRSSAKTFARPARRKSRSSTRALSRVVAESRHGLVILDTAPTGHTLLLLDATGAYHRDVLRGLSAADAQRLVTPLMRLRDPVQTTVLVVTLPEPIPVSEAALLQSDLRRAGIEPILGVPRRVGSTKCVGAPAALRAARA